MIETRVLRVDVDVEREVSIREAAAVIGRGGIVVHPTETVYGLAVDPWSEAAVRRLRGLKERGDDCGFILLVSSLEGARGLVASGTPIAWIAIAEEFWPGPLTLILPPGPAAPGGVRGANGGLALRLTADPIAAALVLASGVPLTSTSANLKGRPPAVTGGEAARELAGRVDVVLEAGPRSSGAPSTILDLTQARPRIVREGAISRSRIEASLRRVKIHGRIGGRRA